MLLEARGNVDGVAADHQLSTRGGLPAGDDLAGVDADAQRHLDPVASAATRCECAESVTHRERSTDSALRIVPMSLGNTEHGDYGVPHELLGRASEALDLGPDHVEELSLDLPHVLRIEPLAQRGRACEVGEENRDDSPLLALVRTAGPSNIVPQRHPAGRAERRRRGLLGSAARAHALERRTAPGAEAGAGRMLGATRGADQPHADESMARTGPRVRPSARVGRRGRQLARAGC